MQAERIDEEVNIRKLNVYPLRYASEETRALLENRGRTFGAAGREGLYHTKTRKKHMAYGLISPFMGCLGLTMLLERRTIHGGLLYLPTATLEFVRFQKGTRLYR